MSYEETEERTDHAVIVEITRRYAVPVEAVSKDEAWAMVHCMRPETVEQIGTPTRVEMTLHEIFDGSPEDE